MNRLAVAIATWFGCGYFPWGPGTIGALAGLLIAMALHFCLGAGRLALLAATLVLLAPAIWASTNAARIVAKSDPGIVVVDEVLGQWTTLLGAAVFNWKALLAGFILFRVFDIWKPWPVWWAERLPGGSGIMADDLFAGVYAALIVFGLLWIGWM